MTFFLKNFTAHLPFYPSYPRPSNPLENNNSIGHSKLWQKIHNVALLVAGVAMIPRVNQIISLESSSLDDPPDPGETTLRQRSLTLFTANGSKPYLAFHLIKFSRFIYLK